MRLSGNAVFDSFLELKATAISIDGRQIDNFKQLQNMISIMPLTKRTYNGQSIIENIADSKFFYHSMLQIKT